MKNSVFRTLPLLLLLFLTGCGASEVTQAGPSTFQVSAQEGLITGGWPAAEKAATAKATEYCTAKGLQYSMIQEQRGGTPGWTPLSTSLTFACNPDVAGQIKAIDAECRTKMGGPDLDLIRNKVELTRESPDQPPPFQVASNDIFPSPTERTAIAKWATIRDGCLQRENDTAKISTAGTALGNTLQQEDRSFYEEATGRVSALIVALYQAKLTYGEFAEKRYEIGRDAAAAERQFREASLIADRARQIQAEQLAQQQFQNNLSAWSTYVQAVNARQPQTVHLSCTSQRLGSFVNTNCD